MRCSRCHAENRDGRRFREDCGGRPATYVHRILSGTKPGDLPINEASKLALAINLKAAKALGLTIPLSLLLRADQVLE